MLVPYFGVKPAYSWDEVYERELDTFQECGDEGEIWFGKSCERRLFEWTCKNVDKNDNIIDLGSGNGHLLVSLAKAGFANLIGIDYCEKAIELASSYAKLMNTNVAFQVENILDNCSLMSKADLITDKGTFDAISLSPTMNIHDLAEKFKSFLSTCMKDNDTSRFIITSCNWTREELCRLFSPELIVVDEILHPSFKFGGSQGQTVTTLIFKRNKKQ